jgi:hypothetical protein
MLTQLPKREHPITDNELLIRLKHRKLIELPRCRKSRTESLNTLPMRARPTVDNALPI